MRGTSLTIDALVAVGLLAAFAMMLHTILFH